MVPWARACTLRSVRVNLTLFTYQPFLLSRSWVNTAGISYSEIVDGCPSLISRLPIGFSTSTSAACGPVTIKNTVKNAKDIPFILAPPLGLGLVLTFHSRSTGKFVENIRSSSPAISDLLEIRLRRAFALLHRPPPPESCSNCRSDTDYRPSRRESVPPSEKDFPLEGFWSSK